MDNLNYTEMRNIIFSLNEWLNTPNEELEMMVGMSWHSFHNLRLRLESELNN